MNLFKSLILFGLLIKWTVCMSVLSGSPCFSLLVGSHQKRLSEIVCMWSSNNLLDFRWASQILHSKYWIFKKIQTWFVKLVNELLNLGLVSSLKLILVRSYCVSLLLLHYEPAAISRSIRAADSWNVASSCCSSINQSLFVSRQFTTEMVSWHFRRSRLSNTLFHLFTETFETRR